MGKVVNEQVVVGDGAMADAAMVRMCILMSNGSRRYEYGRI